MGSDWGGIKSKERRTSATRAFVHLVATIAVLGDGPATVGCSDVVDAHPAALPVWGRFAALFETGVSVAEGAAAE